MNNDIQHFGVLGQKWGHRNGPPYPLGPDVSTGRRLKDAVQRIKERKEEKEKEKKKKKRVEAMRKGKQRKAEERAKEEKRQAKKEERQAKEQKKRDALLKKYMADPAKLYKHRDMFTTEELNKAHERYTAEQNIHSDMIKKLSRGKVFIDAILGYGKTATSAIEIYKKLTGEKKDDKENKENKESSNNTISDKNTKKLEDKQSNNQTKDKQSNNQTKEKDKQSNNQTKEKGKRVERVRGTVVNDKPRGGAKGVRGMKWDVVYDTDWREVAKDYKSAGSNFVKFIDSVTNYKNTPLSIDSSTNYTKTPFLLEDKQRK